MQTAILYINYAVVLLSGLYMTLSFAGISRRKDTLYTITFLFLGCGALQLLCIHYLGIDRNWQLHPLLTHLPLLLTLCLYFKKNLLTAIASLTTAYALCQPARWAGLFLGSIYGGNSYVQFGTNIALQLLTTVLSVRFLTPLLTDIFSKPLKQTLLFSIVPVSHYIFDYTARLYTGLWNSDNQVFAEFLPFLICTFYFVFCMLYYQEYQQRLEAARKRKLTQSTINQQAEKIDHVKFCSNLIDQLYEDMDSGLTGLSQSLERGDQAQAAAALAALQHRLQQAPTHCYCANTVINYQFSYLINQCKQHHVALQLELPPALPAVDELLFSAMLDCMLETAGRAQLELPEERRCIRLEMKLPDTSMLLLFRYAILHPPVVENGTPFIREDGPLRIRYLAEELHGSCQFQVQENYVQIRITI